MLIGCGAATLHACPRNLALGLLPLALARCAWGAYTHAPTAYAPATYARLAASNALGMRALRHVRGMAWRLLPAPTAYLRWGSEACGAALWAGNRSLSLATRLGQRAVQAAAGAVSLIGAPVSPAWGASVSELMTLGE